MAAFPARAIQKGRWRPLLRSVCAFRCAAANAEFYAQEIWSTHVRSRFANGTRIEIGDLSGADAFERNQRGAISRARWAGVRVSRGALAGVDRCGRSSNGQSGGEK